MNRLRIMERFGSLPAGGSAWSAAEEAVLTAYQLIRACEEARSTPAGG